MQVKWLDSNHTGGQLVELGPVIPKPMPSCCGRLHLRDYGITAGVRGGLQELQKGSRLGQAIMREVQLERRVDSFRDQREACEDGHLKVSDGKVVLYQCF